MLSRIQRYQSWSSLILAFSVLAFNGQEIQAQTNSSCNREGSSRSAQTTQAAKLTLTNQTNETLTVYWLDFEGKRQKWFDLSAGQAFDQSTFVGHLWLVTKPNGQCLAIYSAPGNFRIGKPQSSVETNRPTQSQNPTTAQPITPAGGSAAAYYAEGKKYFFAKDFAKAVEPFKKAIALNPGMDAAHNFLANCYLILNQYQNALPPAKEAVRLKPKEHTHHFTLGMTYFFLKQYENAFSTLQQAVRLDSTFAESHYWSGRVYVEGFKQYENGVSSFQQALRLDPDNAPYHRDLGMTYVRLGRKDDALRVYSKLLTLDKKQAQRLYDDINKEPSPQPAAKGGNAKATTGTSAKTSQPKASSGAAPAKGNGAPPQSVMNTVSPSQSATPKDAAPDLAALQAKAERGDAAAQYKLADYYFSIINVAEGDKWLRKAAEGGNPDAHNSLGFRHLTGRDGSANVEEGRRWLKKAGAQGHTVALGHLCGSYVEKMNLREGAVPPGDFPPARVASIRQDVTEALNWCGKSANEGNAMSQYNLGLLYAKGSADFKPDYEKAYFWLSVRNAPAAKAFRERIGQQLTPEKRAEVEQKAREFKTAGKSPRPPAANHQ